jgi:hypothetical protein
MTDDRIVLALGRSSDRIIRGEEVDFDILSGVADNGVGAIADSGNNTVAVEKLRLIVLIAAGVPLEFVIEELLRQNRGDDVAIAAILRRLLDVFVPVAAPQAPPAPPVQAEEQKPSRRPIPDSFLTDGEDGTTATAAAFTDVPEGAGVTGSRPTQPTDTEPSVRRRRWFQGGDSPSGNPGTTGTTSANLR